MDIDVSTVTAFAGGLLLLIAVVLFIVPKPIKKLIKLVLNGLIGGVTLWIVNLIGSSVGLFVPLNPLTALIAGILGFPGVILLIVIGFIK